MCVSMVDIQSGPLRLGEQKEEEERKKPQGKNIMSASATQGGHNKDKICSLCKLVVFKRPHDVSTSVTDLFTSI